MMKEKANTMKAQLRTYPRMVLCSLLIVLLLLTACGGGEAPVEEAPAAPVTSEEAGEGAPTKEASEEMEAEGEAEGKEMEAEGEAEGEEMEAKAEGEEMEAEGEEMEAEGEAEMEAEMEAEGEEMDAEAESASAAPSSDFGYGIQAHLIHIDRGLPFANVTGLGFGWVKQQIEWKAWEANQGDIDWSQMDAIAEESQANGLNAMYSVVGAPDWAREEGFDATVTGPPADPATFATFLGELAGRYCENGVGAIEVWNEQNLHYEWGNKTLSPADYVALLKPAYEAIKTACPSMIVVSGGLTPAGDVPEKAIDDFTYMQGMVESGVAEYADAIGAHPSGYNVPPSITYEEACAFIQEKGTTFTGPCDDPHHSWSFRSTLEGYRDIIEQGGSSQPIWVTEFGWAAGGSFEAGYEYADDNTLEEQAQWSVEAFEYMRDSDFVDAAFLWNLNFRMVADGTEKAQWGIVANNSQPFPAFLSLQAMPK